MSLGALLVEDLRCVERAQLELDPRSTLISGPNGSGKSSLLEAIYLLGRGRSFRTTDLQALIRNGADRFRVVGQFNSSPTFFPPSALEAAGAGGGGSSSPPSPSPRVFTIGLETSPTGFSARIAGEAAPSLAALSVHFPVQIIEPGIHKLIEEGSVRRRRFLDWGVFHVEPQYLEQWQRFNRVLRQRNAALQAQASDAVLDAWDVEFAEAGERVNASRASYLEALRPYLDAAIAELLQEPVAIGYRSGWAEGRVLAEVLVDSRRNDRLRKTSTAGPHRADVVFRAGGGLARQVVSRGQQKLLATCAVLGQLAYHIHASGLRPTLLLDDPAAELDAERLRLLLSQVERLGVQLVTTSLFRDFNALGEPGKRFHVEHGRVTPL